MKGKEKAEQKHRCYSNQKWRLEKTTYLFTKEPDKAEMGEAKASRREVPKMGED